MYFTKKFHRQLSSTLMSTLRLSLYPKNYDV